MIVSESSRTRRLVGRLDRGADLLAQLIDVCRVHNVRAGALRAVGALEEVVLGEWDQRTRALRPPRRFDAQFEILALSGTVAEHNGAPSLQAWVSLSRERDNGIELVGGRLLGGRVFACEFVLDTFDDLALARVVEPATGLPLWEPTGAMPSPSPVPNAPPLAPVPPRAVEPRAVEPRAVERAPEPRAPSFEAPARTTWSDVVAASERRAEPIRPVEPVEAEPRAVVPPAEYTEVQVRPGDYIDHPKFGRVQVERVGSDNEYISARLRNQRLIRLSLEVLTLIPAGEADGHPLFRAVTGGGQ